MRIEQTESFVEHEIYVGDTKIGEVELCPERHEISRLVIYEPFQNKGYGTTAVKGLVRRGYNNLWVRSDNPRAIHVYEKCGFRKSNTVMYRMDLEDDLEINPCKGCPDFDGYDCTSKGACADGGDRDG